MYMKKITALDWISNSIKSEDLYDNRSNLGLNKHVQKKYEEKDAIEEISEIRKIIEYVLENSKDIKMGTTSSSNDELYIEYFDVPSEWFNTKKIFCDYVVTCKFNLDYNNDKIIVNITLDSNDGGTVAHDLVECPMNDLDQLVEDIEDAIENFSDLYYLFNEFD